VTSDPGPRLEPNFNPPAEDLKSYVQEIQAMFSVFLYDGRTSRFELLKDLEMDA
jgi:hypothetical protein